MLTCGGGGQKTRGPQCKATERDIQQFEERVQRFAHVHVLPKPLQEALEVLQKSAGKHIDSLMSHFRKIPDAQSPVLVPRALSVHSQPIELIYVSIP